MTDETTMRVKKEQKEKLRSYGSAMCMSLGVKVSEKESDLLDMALNDAMKFRGIKLGYEKDMQKKWMEKKKVKK